VVGTELGTSVGTGDVRVLTVEHVMAALSARGIDNAVLELSGPEPPILDGSFQGYVEALTRAGIEEQGAPRQCIRITEPVTLRLDSGEFYVAAPGQGTAGLRHHRIRARLHRTPVRDLPLEPGSLR
jgi:UDP-3-O-[3-hydroxymyristoyl] N-acetylglucosamine deacetylase